MLDQDVEVLGWRVERCGDDEDDVGEDVSGDVLVSWGAGEFVSWVASQSGCAGTIV